MNRQPIIAVLAAALLLAVGAATAAEAPEGLSDGIKVHGHWKIEILESDGTLVSVTEFDNALHGMGAGSLVLVLDSRVSIGGWMVRLLSDSDGACDFNGMHSPCIIGQSGVTYVDQPHSTSLTATATGSQFQLSGTVVAEYDATLNSVHTFAKYCPQNISPETCTTTQVNEGIFTFTTLASPPSVVAGQIIQVTVTISFS